MQLTERPFLLCVIIIGLYGCVSHHTVLGQATGCAADPTYCGANGVCANDVCVCSSSRWTGALCDECAPGWAGATCSTECLGGACNICNSHGVCSQGTSGDGSCTCYSSSLLGFWTGSDCTYCQNGYYGPQCSAPCPGLLSGGQACFGRGICADDVKGNGSCTCITGWDDASGCADCDRSHYGFGCAQLCTGYVESTNDACSGNGICFNGTAGNGSCVCFEGYGSSDCSIQCLGNGTCFGNGICTPEAECLCKPNFLPPSCEECMPNLTGWPECDVPCPLDENGDVCSGNGNCYWDSIAGAYCSCGPGYFGAVCQSSCAGNPPCSGNGNCSINTESGTPQCTCFADEVNGYWAGSLCDRCMPAYNGSFACNLMCPLGANGEPCSGNGNCFNGTCYCYRGADIEYCGLACDVFSVPGATTVSGSCVSCSCVYCSTIGVYGSSCATPCPGRSAGSGSALPISCNGNGFCSEGVSGTGLCACQQSWSGPSCGITCANSSVNGVCSGFSRGICSLNPNTGEGVCSCRAGFGGAACELACPVVAGLVCAGHGSCSDGATGNATCLCDPEWTGLSCEVPCACNLAHGACDPVACASLTGSDTCTACLCDSNFTNLCDACVPGTQGVNCEGPCVNGLTTGTTCVCYANWSTASCSVPCPTDNTTNGAICGDHGTCLQGSSQPGTCVCDTDYYGSACTVYCTAALCRALSLLLYPQCNPVSGQCECQYSTQGYWSGTSCSTCASGYWGPSCQLECDCSGHGVCDMSSGLCSCFASAAQGYFEGTDCSSCSSGFIGPYCNQTNVVISRVDAFADVVDPLYVSLEAQSLTPVPLPSPTLMLVDEDNGVLLVGGAPVYMFDLTSLPSVNLMTNSSAFVNVGPRLCTYEAFTAWRDATSYFFLMQPSPSCNFPVRILSSSLSSTAPLNFPEMQTIWSWASPNTTIRILAANGSSVEDPASVVAFILVQYSDVGGHGTQYPGGYLIVVDVQEVIKSSFTSGTTQWSLPGSFIPFDVSLTFALLSASDAIASQLIAVSGSLDGSWEVFLYSMSASGLVPAIPGAVNATVSNQVMPCWPVVGSALNGGSPYSLTAGSSTDSCVGCSAALKVSFFGTSLVIAMFVDTGTLNETLMVLLSPFSAVEASTPLWAMSDDTGSCVPSIYNPVTRGIIPMSSMSPSSTNLTPTGWFFAQVASTGISGTYATALTIDGAADVLYVSYRVNEGFSPSILAKLNIIIGNFSVYGVIELDILFVSGSATPEVLGAFAVDPSRRLLYAVVSGVPELRIATFLLYEVFSIDPTLASQRGGTVIQLRGRGFQTILNATTLQPAYPVVCVFGSSDTDIVPGTSLTFDAMVCVTPPVNNSLPWAGVCAGSAVEVSLFGTFWFTSNGVMLRRLPNPQVGNATPSRGSVRGGTPVTVYGSDFVESPYATCLFWSSNPQSEEVLTSTLTYTSPTAAVCVQPHATSPSFSPSFVNVSLDGQQWSLNGPVPYDIVGYAQNLSSPQTVTVTANIEVQFNVNVIVVDAQGHPLLDFDSIPYLVCVALNVSNGPCDAAALSWRSPDDGYPWPPCRNNSIFINSTVSENGTFCQPTTNGVVEFSDMTLLTPRATNLTLMFHSASTTLSWATITTVEVIVGAAYALAIQNRAALVGVRFANNQALAPPPEIIVVDVLGNVLPTPSPNMIIVAQTFFQLDISNHTHQTNSYTQTPSQGADIIRFSQIFLDYINGANNWINFSSQNPSLQWTITPPFRTTMCNNPTMEYKVINTSTCAPCPPTGAVCNGTEFIEVLPGYWRGQTYSYIYPCPAGADVCLGSQQLTGSACAFAYQGTLCGECIPGYGRTTGGGCAKCGSEAVALTVIILAALAFIIVLLLWTVFTLSSPTVTDLTVILRTLVNHLQAMGKLGEFSTQWGTFLKSIFSAQNSASTVSVSGISYLDCLLLESGNNITAVFTAYMMLPAVAVILAFLVFVAVRAIRMKPVLSEEVIQEVENDARIFGPEAPLTRLKVQYPFDFVATVTLSVNMFALYQTIITQSTSVIACSSFVVAEGVTKSYLNADMRVPCDASGNSALTTPAIICTVLYGFGIPFFFFIGFKFTEGRLRKPAVTRMMYMFLVGGYKPQYWFWQLTIMIRKLLLVVIAAFIVDNAPLQSYCGMWLMSASLVAQMWFQPAEKSVFNLVETLSLSIITITLNLGLLYFWPGMSATGQTVLTATLVVITLGSLVMFGYFLYGPILQTIREVLEELHSPKSEEAASEETPVAPERSSNPNEVSGKPATSAKTAVVGQRQQNMPSFLEVDEDEFRGEAPRILNQPRSNPCLSIKFDEL